MKRLLPTLAAIAALLCASSATATELTFAPRIALAHAAAPAPPPSSVYPLQLVLDDNTDEGAFGFTSGQNAQQFMWFNRFTVPGGNYLLQQVWVLFPSNQNISVGAPIQLAIYVDSDSNPANGATLIATLNETVQAADDVNFSIYTLDQPLQFSQSSDVLIGVIPRFIVSGTTPPTNPAAVDTTASQGRSWVAIWTGDPPNPPTLPPDVLITRLDDGLQPGGGNWMIRAFGAPLGNATASVPVLSVPWLVVLSITLAAFGVFFQRRASRPRVLVRRRPTK